MQTNDMLVPVIKADHLRRYLCPECLVDVTKRERTIIGDMEVNVDYYSSCPKCGKLLNYEPLLLEQINKIKGMQANEKY